MVRARWRIGPWLDGVRDPSTVLDVPFSCLESGPYWDRCSFKRQYSIDILMLVM